MPSQPRQLHQGERHFVLEQTLIIYIYLYIHWPVTVSSFWIGIIVLIVLLLLYNICVIPWQWLCGHGIFNMRNNLSLCCVHKSTTGTEESEWVSTRKNWKSPSLCYDSATDPCNTCQNSTDLTQPTSTDLWQSPPTILTPVRIPQTTHNPHPLTCDSLHQHLPLGKLLLQVSNFSFVASISQCELCANMGAHSPVSHVIIGHAYLLQSCSVCSITPCA